MNVPIDAAPTELSAPPAPRSLAETGLPEPFLQALVCKHLHRRGAQRLIELGAACRLPSALVEAIIDSLRAERLVEVAGTSSPFNIAFSLSEQGRRRAEVHLRASHFVGPAPVPLAAYIAQVEAQSVHRIRISRAAMRAAFADVVLDDSIVDQLGVGLHSGRSVYLYGPAGSGKTYVAGRLARLFGGTIHVPHALYVDGHVVQLYDPVVHQAVAAADGAVPDGARATPDARWVACRRPVVVAGGELTIDMLDLRQDEVARGYVAPPQLKANNGLLVIDDLGRQRVSARDLLNRWIVPLERRTDSLGLATGEKLAVPFDMNLVFCSNLLPAELGDDAFLRRLGHKIHLGPLQESAYRELCVRTCNNLGIDYTPRAIAHLLERFRDARRPLLACTPRDLLGQVADQARYFGERAVLTEAAIESAWNNYFADDTVVSTAWKETT